MYYGSTIRTLYTRVSDHKGMSDRKGKPVVKRKLSSIQEHVITCGTEFHMDYFNIVASNNKKIDLRIKESNLIHKDVK